MEYADVITDAHVHMGYYPRVDHEGLKYYSPRRVLGILNRCGVQEFIVSSTCSQIREFGIDTIVREAQEMKRLAGRRAHIFFWLSGHLFEQDPNMTWMNDGIFEGIKFHEKETPWFSCRQKELRKILDYVAERELPVQFHTGDDNGCRPVELIQLAKDYPSIHFDFAHCRHPEQSATAIAECPNVYVDTAYFENDFSKLQSYDWRKRLMYGSDLPVWQAHCDLALTPFYRKNLTDFYQTFSHNSNAFHNFLKGGRIDKESHHPKSKA